MEHASTVLNLVDDTDLRKLARTDVGLDEF